MVFSLQFCTPEDLHPYDEAVALDSDTAADAAEEEADTEAKKFYVSQNAFLKVLGATVDVDLETMEPILLDKEGNRLDPNA